MFPNGWPGSGLLLLRLVAGSLLIHNGITGLTGPPRSEPVTAQVIAAIGGIFLIAGLWTPVAGAVVTISELWIAFSRGDHLPNAVILAAIGAAVAMLGPGARSIDALLFGRKRLNVRER
jgi:putative oxidoreductase